ncbi:MAG TPA: hypothetical protein ENJ10_12525 [Caldithrix abyssi]|uniref:Uncharacterized protein n=1 Tax=Caldithrix abyssi TaxID=187145 RepID=A0A7V1LP09_CALAY|nr:hypothetical protein [Caldithrix abyssi]
MKKVLYISVLILLMALAFYLDESGLITWQPLAMIVAALAAPFRLVWNMINNSEEKIREKHERIRQREKQYQDTLESKIGRRERRIEELDRQLNDLERQVERLEQKRSEVERVVERMNEDELKRAVWKYAGR